MPGKIIKLFDTQADWESGTLSNMDSTTKPGSIAPNPSFSKTYTVGVSLDWYNWKQGASIQFFYEGDELVNPQRMIDGNITTYAQKMPLGYTASMVANYSTARQFSGIQIYQGPLAKGNVRLFRGSTQVFGWTSLTASGGWKTINFSSAQDTIWILDIQQDTIIYEVEFLPTDYYITPKTWTSSWDVFGISGSFTSTFTLNATIPSGTEVKAYVRYSSTGQDNPTWQEITGSSLPGTGGNYIQFKIELSTTDTSKTPTVNSFSVTAGPEVYWISPVIDTSRAKSDRLTIGVETDMDIKRSIRASNYTFARDSVAYKLDGTQVAANVPRFEDGKFGKAVMVEEGTTNLLASATAPVEETVNVTPDSAYTLSVDAGSATVKRTVSRTETTQADFASGTLTNVVATAAGDLELAVTGLQISDGSSLSGWTAVGATVDTTTGNPAPSLKALGGQYAYKDVGLKPGDTIEFDVYIIPGTTALCNFYFLCDANGAGQMLRLDARGGTNYSGFASTTSWTQWTAPSSGFTVSAGVWYHVKLVIGQSTVEAFVDGVSKGTFTFTNKGGYIAVHGDGATVTGGYFDNIVISKYASSGTRLSPVYDISPVGTAASSTISWNATLPTSTSLTIETNLSLDGGVTWQGWQVCTNGGAIPGVNGNDMTGKSLLVRQTLATSDTTVTPQLHDITVRAEGTTETLYGTATPTTPLTFTPNVNTVVCTPTGVTKWQLEQKSYATSFTVGTRSPETLTIPTDSVIDPRECTIEFWAYVDAQVRDTSRIRRFFSHFNGTGNANRITIQHSNSPQWIFTIANNDGNVLSLEVPDSDTPDGWHYFAMKWSSSQFAVYLNGVKKAYVNNPTFLPEYLAPTADIGHTNGSEQANSLIDDLRISSIARSDAEILAAYQSGQPLERDAYTTYYEPFDASYYWQVVGVVFENPHTVSLQVKIEPSKTKIGDQYIDSLGLWDTITLPMLERPDIELAPPECNKVTVYTGATEKSAIVPGTSSDRIVEIRVEAPEDSSETYCQQMADIILAAKSKERISITCKVPLVTSLRFGELVPVILPYIGATIDTPYMAHVQRMEHHILENPPYTILSLGDFLPDDIEALVRLLKEG